MQARTSRASQAPFAIRWARAEEIIENLEAGLDSFREVLADLAGS